MGIRDQRPTWPARRESCILPSMAGKTILIVDDDQTLVSLLKEGLESLGFKVCVAFDGMQGILLAHQVHPDVVILDFQMPGGGGGTVFERLRGAPDTAKVPIVFSTVVSTEELRGKIRADALTHFLRKPVAVRQFLAVLNKILGTTVPEVSGAAVVAPPSPVPAPVAAPVPARPPAPPARKAKFHEFEVRVTYADTDKMGIIYYANYFRYFEQGRTELLRSLGVRYRDLEIQRKLFFPVVEADCQYLAPSRYDDLLTVRTWISDIGKASLRFEYEIFDQDLGGRKAAKGFSRHALVNDLWRPARAPEDLRRLVEPYVGKL